MDTYVFVSMFVCMYDNADIIHNLVFCQHLKAKIWKHFHFLRTVEA